MVKEQIAQLVENYKSVVDGASNFKNLTHVLREINPSLTLRGLSRYRMQKRLRVGITTRFLNTETALRDLSLSVERWGYPFDRVFLVSKTDTNSILFLTEKSWKFEMYPSSLTGNLAKIRGWAQEHEYDVVSDDDPDKVFKIVFPAAGAKAGVFQPKPTSELFHDMWAFALEMGRIHGIPLVGMNGSDATQCSAGHGRCMCKLTTHPLTLDGTITTAQGFASIKNYHNFVAKEFSKQRVAQEFSAAAALAVRDRNLVGKHGTLTLMFLKFKCRVNPPSAESLQSVHLLAEACPKVVNSYRTVCNNNCIVRFKTLNQISELRRKV